MSRVRLALVFAVFASLLTAQPTLNKAEELYKHTEFEGSLALLDKHSGDAPTLFLVGRDYYMLGDFKKSTEFLERATQSNPKSSEYMDWLGRSWGKRAETSNVFSAPGFASKARQAFEQSVQLDPKNHDALSDLFDYYLNAPGFMGGGYDKAEEVAEKIAVVDPPEGFFVKAQLAQKRQEYPAAEQQLRQAIAVAPHELGHMIALAKFLANQGRTRESDAVFAQAQRLHPAAPQLWYARADVLIKEKRNLDEAKVLLEKYMQASITVDDPSKQQAERLLKQAGGA